MVGSSVSVEGERDVVLALVLVGESDTCADRDLRANDSITAVETGREHVHGTTLSVGDTLATAEQLTDDGANGAAAHHGEAVAAVCGDEVVHLGDRVLDADSDSLLAGRQMAETPDLLLLVQTIGGHFHAAVVADH